MSPKTVPGPSPAGKAEFERIGKTQHGSQRIQLLS